MSNVLRNIPSVRELLESPPLKSLVNRVSHNVVVGGVRRFLDDLRGQVQGTTGINIPSASELAERIAQWIAVTEQQPLRPVINATGILLHTGLGRAPLSDAAIAAVDAIAAGYASVEVDLASGERSQRVVAVESLLTRLTGAEAAAVVNNNAGATVLTLAALAAGRKVIVSRGQLIEIGGSYRLPEVMSASGAVLREVGTTNKTRASDYAAAIGERTAAILRVHTSNYKVVGFAEEAPLTDLVALGRRHNLPVIDDIGSGALIDLVPYGIRGEPVAGQSVAAGADLVLFSGDKLLGGPQCGIIVGRRTHIERIVKHPLMRALRVDKLTLAALAATLQAYRDPQLAERSIPVLSLLATPLENLRNRAERLSPQISATGVAIAEVIEDESYVGGGSVPSQTMKTICLALTSKSHQAAQLAAALRTGKPAVVGRIKDNRLLLDLRSVAPKFDVALVEAVQALARPHAAPASPPEPNPA
ncbi:MAG: L-seryl-tRNA(Sec) selenium transferase [Planctomycetaceae bacterium]|nr:L-seryl-tRNA(Sec) selenium transferase [Planctomycetaceae bacterium]